MLFFDKVFTISIYIFDIAIDHVWFVSIYIFNTAVSCLILGVSVYIFNTAINCLICISLYFLIYTRD